MMGIPGKQFEGRGENRSFGLTENIREYHRSARVHG